MKVTAIMATCGRHFCSERSLTMFLDQTYDNKHLLIYQNSEVFQTLDASVDRSLVTLINNNIDRSTGRPYETLGAIYKDAIDYLPKDTDVIIFWDDDDLFLVEHIEEGVKGLVRGGKIAYKPAMSYFKTQECTEMVVNTLEPSIFVSASHIYKYGFGESTTEQHLQWLEPLVKMGEIFVDEGGRPTLIYNWGDSFPTFKTSGDSGNPDNFCNYRKYSQDHGDGIISPICG